MVLEFRRCCKQWFAHDNNNNYNNYNKNRQRHLEQHSFPDRGKTRHSFLLVSCFAGLEHSSPERIRLPLWSLFAGQPASVCDWQGCQQYDTQKFMHRRLTSSESRNPGKDVGEIRTRVDNRYPRLFTITSRTMILLRPGLGTRTQWCPFTRLFTKLWQWEGISDHL